MKEVRVQSDLLCNLLLALHVSCIALHVLSGAVPAQQTGPTQPWL